MNAIEALPKNGNVAEWSEQEKALVEAAGLVSRGNLAPRPTVEAFLAHCRRTGLDPIARQIYAIERGGKWGIQISIDGARLVAERSKQYQGQTPTQWTADGLTWVDVWLSDTPPAAARVGVRRAGFAEPLVTVATWKEYAILNGPMWKKMPALMLSKVAEMLALRKAFPQDLSGLYSAEEMDQATTAPAPGEGAQVAAVPAVEAPAEVRAPARDWLKDANATTSYDELKLVFEAAAEAGDLMVQIADGRSLKEYLFERKAALLGAVEAAGPAPVDNVEDAVEVTDEPAETATWDVAPIPNGDES